MRTAVTCRGSVSSNSACSKIASLQSARINPRSAISFRRASSDSVPPAGSNWRDHRIRRGSAGAVASDDSPASRAVAPTTDDVGTYAGSSANVDRRGNGTGSLTTPSSNSSVAVVVAAGSRPDERMNAYTMNAQHHEGERRSPTFPWARPGRGAGRLTCAARPRARLRARLRRACAARLRNRSARGRASTRTAAATPHDNRRSSPPARRRVRAMSRSASTPHATAPR